jgi:hypothetical protein
MNIVDVQYFESYGNKEIHEEMLQDVERINAYRIALSLLSNKKDCHRCRCRHRHSQYDRNGLRGHLCLCNREEHNLPSGYK